LDIRRRAGGSPSPRVSRTTLKPRVLFVSEEQRKAREAAAAEEADEEALTDIEVPSPSTKKEALKEAPSTPPPDYQAELVVVVQEISESTAATNTLIPESSSQAETGEELTNKHLSRPKKPRASSPFDKWTRIKPSLAAPVETKSKKRAASPTEQPTKRVRSDAT
jgi:hypothetical protein